MKTQIPMCISFLNNKPKIHTEKKKTRKVSSTNGTGQGMTACRMMKTDSYPFIHSCTKLNYKWIKDFNMRPAILNLKKEIVGIGVTSLAQEELSGQDTIASTDTKTSNQQIGPSEAEKLRYSKGHHHLCRVKA